MEMEGKVVVVTGASMGIGEAIAKIFADAGASVVLLSRDANRAEAARHRVGHTDRTLAMACDVRNREDIGRALELTLHHFDRVDVWVNNAGVGIRDSVADMETSAVRELFETNFFGAIACMQAVLPAMREEGGGTIINISSVAGHIPVPFMTLYCASKFAVNALGKGARLELRRDHINVLTVCPGYVSTEFGEHLVANRQGSVRPQSVRGITAERVAQAAYRGFRRGKREVVVPWTMIPVIKLYQLFPGLVEWGMAKAMKSSIKGATVDR
ncbi:MAG TPA: SDR family NAD(P)-dependent oxidoreductase [Gemmataceae bacterium]|nr:SDR family NAD(P)-dependent oxidoreductase [Terriglobales bacterium]HLN30687.1 SDR family NAD(P)-dependent oxidoreductase [Gemmataceae bacterium]